MDASDDRSDMHKHPGPPTSACDPIVFDRVLSLFGLKFLSTNADRREYLELFKGVKNA